jgi:hypothetical protein
MTTYQFSTFDFSEPVGSYLVGLSNFTYTYPSSDEHHILQFSLAMQDNFSPPQKVQVQPVCVMQDDNGQQPRGAAIAGPRDGCSAVEYAAREQHHLWPGQS